MGAMKPSISNIFGLDQSHLTQVPGCGNATRYLGYPVIDDFTLLRETLAEHGVQLAIASSYRSFQQQQLIWNEKFNGNRAVFDADGLPLDMSSLDDFEKVFAILRWSALPGASRHHWGSDLDIYDLAALPQGYQLKLIPAEYQSNGPFSLLGDLLDQHFAVGDFCGFYRPYMGKLSAVANEPWHISHRASAQQSMSILTKSALQQLVENSDIAGKSTVLMHFDEIWQRFVAID
jgi:LAS superfamily LD-carboxypeptidase LdcB